MNNEIVASLWAEKLWRAGDGKLIIEFQGPYSVSTDSINSHENNTDELHCGKTLIWTLKKFYPLV